MLTSLSASAIVGEQVYGPYGNPRYQVGTMGTTKGYTGQFHDAVSGLDYYHARYYDPVVGQFLSVDEKVGNAQGADPYSYVAGNPETATDPTGLRISCPPDCGILSGVPGNIPCAFGGTGCGGDCGDRCGGGGPLPTPHPAPTPTPKPSPTPTPAATPSPTAKVAVSPDGGNDDCGNLSQAQCNQAQGTRKHQTDGYAQTIKWLGLLGTLISLGLDAIPFGKDLLALMKSFSLQGLLVVSPV